MDAKPKALDSKKIAEDEKKTKKDDAMTTHDGQRFTIIKGHLKIMEGFSQANTRDVQSLKSSQSSSSSSSYVEIRNYKNSIQRSENTTHEKMENLHNNKKVINHLKQNSEESNVHKKVWDCESTLYDSFELNSFNLQLDSAISSSARSMSMPHFPPPPHPSETTSSSSTKKQSSNKISRSLQKLIKSIFRQKQPNTPFKACHGVDMDKYYVVFDKAGSLTTIPELGESSDLVGSEINSLVRKTVSERFQPSRLAGISYS